MLKILLFLPPKYLFFPFRKYIDVQGLAEDIASGKIRSFYFIRDQVARILQIKQKQFDKSGELNQARGVYLDKLTTNSALSHLNIINDYGDITDALALKHLKDKTGNEIIRQKCEELLMTTYSGV
jgi:hypothetical protein